MWAELTFRTKSDLPNDIAGALVSRFSPSASPRDALDSTTYYGDYEFENDIVYAHKSASTVYLVFRPEARLLKIHIESDNDKSSLRELRRCLGTVSKSFESFLKYHQIKSDGIGAVISAEDSHIQVANRLGWSQKVVHSVRNNAIGEAYVPIAAFTASMILGYQIAESLFNAFVALIALALWVLLDATAFVPDYVYLEE